MKKKLIIFSLFFLFIIINKRGEAIPYNNSRPLLKGEISIGGGIYLDIDKNYGVITQFEYGWNKYVVPYFKTGYIESFYAAAGSKIIITSMFGGVDYLSIIPAFHYYKGMGGEISVISGNLYKNFDFYVGFHFDLNYIDNQLEYPVNFIIGFIFSPFGRGKGVLIEAGIPATSYSSYQLGAMFKFNI